MADNTKRNSLSGIPNSTVAQKAQTQTKKKRQKKKKKTQIKIQNANKMETSGGLGPVHTKTIVNANASKRIFLSPSTRKRSSFT